jgi:RHS repeat-associated protein
LQDELWLNMYDMDLRQYDPAIGRFISLDPVVHYNQSTYTAFDNNPIYWADPSGMTGEHYDWNTGTYMNDKKQTVTFGEAMASQGLNTDGSEKSEQGSNEASTENTTASNNSTDIHPRGNDFKNRPRTTKVIEQLYGYVKNHPSVLETLAEYSGYSTMEVLQQLKYNQGDMILGIENLDWNKYSPEGITITARDIRLEINNSNKLETAKTNEKIQSTSFFIAVTVLHEFVHAGRKANNMDKKGEKNEMGWGWELRVFGAPTTPSNASEMYKKYDWNFKY